MRRVLVAALFVASTMAVPPARAEVTERIGSLVSQDQYVAGIEGAVIDISISLEGASALGSGNPTSIVITAHRPVRDRQAVRAAASGELPSTIDSLRVPVVDRDASGIVDLAVPIEIGTRLPERLQMSAPGLYPVSISLEVGGDVVNRLVTFVERLADGVETPVVDQPLPVALVGRIDGDVTLQPDGTTVVRDEDRSRVANLATIVESLPGTPLTVAVRPELLEGLTRSTSDDLDLVARLQFADTTSFTSTPYVSVDPGSSADSSSADVFTGQLRLGEDVLADVLPGSTVRRTTWIQDRPLSANGARFVRDLGFRSLLVTPQAVNAGAFPGATYADPTRLMDVELSGGGAIDAFIPDLSLAQTLTAASDASPSDAYLVAQHVLAEIKALRTEIVDAGETTTGRSLVLTTNDGSLMSTDLLTSLADTLGSSVVVQLVNLDDALARSDVGLIDGRPATITLPSAVDIPPSTTVDVLFRTSARIDAFASMLPDGDGRPDMWRRLLEVVPDDRLSSEQRAAYADVVGAETDAIARLVATPASTTFTLGGRNSEIRLGLRNDSTSELQVRIRLNSSKLRFPEGEPVVTLAAESITSVEIPVRARSNGRFPVTVQILTPTGDAPISAPIVFTARVNALAGLGQLTTILALLVLAVWWASHLRKRRREN